MLNASNAEGVTSIVCGGCDGSVRGTVVGVEGTELDTRLKISMTACRSVAAAVDETTDTRESWSLKHNKSAFMNRLAISTRAI